MDRNKIFKAIADPTRREIFHILIMASSTLSITQITGHFDITRQGVAKHITVLEDAGLVHTKEVGRERFCTANPAPLSEVTDWVEFYNKFWDDKLRKLDDHLSQS